MADRGRPWWNGSSMKTPPPQSPSTVIKQSPLRGKGMTPILCTPAAINVKPEPLSPRCKPPAFSPHVGHHNGKQGAFPWLPVKSEPVPNIKSEPMAYLERALKKGEFPRDFNWPLMKWEPLSGINANLVKQESKHYIPDPKSNIFSRMNIKFNEPFAQRNYNRPPPNWHYIYTRERYEPTDATRAWWNVNVERALNRRREAYLLTKERDSVPIEVRMERIFQFQLAKDEVRRVIAESKWKAQFGGGITENNDRVNYGASCSGVSQQPANFGFPKSSGMSVKERLGQLITVPDDESQEKENATDKEDNDPDEIQLIPNSKSEVQVYTIDDEIEEAMSNSDDDSDDIRVVSEGNSDIIFIQKKQGEVMILAQVEGRVVKMNRKRKLCVTFGNTAKQSRLLNEDVEENREIDRVDSEKEVEGTPIKEQGNESHIADGKCLHDNSVSVTRALHFSKRMQTGATRSEAGDDCRLGPDAQENTQLQIGELAQDDKMDSDNSMGVSEIQISVPPSGRDKVDSQNCIRDTNDTECLVCEDVSVETLIESSVEVEEEVDKSSVAEDAVYDVVALVEDSNDMMSVAEDSNDVMALIDDSNDVVAITADSDGVIVSEDCSDEVSVAEDTANVVGAAKGSLVTTTPGKVLIDKAAVVEGATDVETVKDDDGNVENAGKNTMVAAIVTDDDAEVEIIDDDTTSEVTAITTSITTTSEGTLEVATDTVGTDKNYVVLLDLENSDRSASEGIGGGVEETCTGGTGDIEAVEPTCKGVEDIAELESNSRKDASAHRTKRRSLQGSRNIQHEEDRRTNAGCDSSSEKKNQNTVEQRKCGAGEDVIEIFLGSDDTLDESVEDNSVSECSVQKEDATVEPDDVTEGSSTGEIEVLEVLTAGVGVASKESGRATRLASRACLNKSGAIVEEDDKDFSQPRQQTTESIGIRRTRQNLFEKAAFDSQKQSAESSGKGINTGKQFSGKGNTAKEQIAGNDKKAEPQSPSTYSFRRRSRRI